MAGLASKWATDEALVEEAKKQEARAKKPLESKWATPTVSEKTKALPSKWANDDYLVTDQYDQKDPKESTRRKGRQGRKGSPKKDLLEEAVLPTPPRTAEKTSKGEMSEAAKQFATRLNLDGASSGKSHKEGSRNDRTTRDRRSDHHANSESPKDDGRKASPKEDGRRASPKDDIRGASPKEESSHSDGKKKRSGKRGGRNRRLSSVGGDPESDERAPLTAAGKSLLDRIGPVPAKGASNNESDFESTEEEVSDDEKRAAHSGPKSRTLAEILHLKLETPKKAYLTPKQRREENMKSKREEENKRLRAAQAEKDAKLKEEVKEMFNKMGDTTTSWADIEDDFE